MLLYPGMGLSIRKISANNQVFEVDSTNSSHVENVKKVIKERKTVDDRKKTQK